MFVMSALPNANPFLHIVPSKPFRGGTEISRSIKIVGRLVVVLYVSEREA